MRAASLHDARMRDGLRCPACSRIDWQADGLAVVEGTDGSLLVEGLDVAGSRQVSDWDCRRCGYRAEESTRPSRLLARVLIASRFGYLS